MKGPTKVVVAEVVRRTLAWFKGKLCFCDTACPSQYTSMSSYQRGKQHYIF